VRELIYRLVIENKSWGAPRIHGEPKMLGYDVSERSVLRWMRKALRDPEPAKQWTTFLNNHRKAIAAMDFFTLPTLTFGVLYCFFIIAHERRRILRWSTRGQIKQVTQFAEGFHVYVAGLGWPDLVANR